MAEAAGLVLGGITLASLFGDCMSCFEYVRLGRNYGKDSQKCLLKLNLVRLRLSRWEASIKNASNPAEPYNGRELALKSQQEADTVKALLGHIMLAFEDAEKKSRKFGIKAHSEELAASGTAAIHRGNDDCLLRSNVQDFALRQQKRTSLVKKVAWAPYGKREFESLIEDLDGFVNDLVKMFPANQKESSI